MNKRTIHYLFVHCTATRQQCSAAQITAAFKSRGWKRPGYHYLVSTDGRLHTLLDEQATANGVKGYNASSIHIAYILDGQGHPADTRTPAQKATLRAILSQLKAQYPQARILGHRDISPDRNHNGIVDPWERIKECPCFNAKDEYGGIG